MIGTAPMMTTQEAIAAFLRVLLADGETFEVRAPKCPSRKGGDFRTTMAGYFSDPDKAAEAAMELERACEPPGIYVTLNPVNGDLRARLHNRLARLDNTTADPDVTCRRNLLVDLDPTRPAGTSSTDREMEAALDLARCVADTLEGEGWPRPIITMSGNGAGLIYRIELPNDEASRDLIQNVLKTLASRFNTEAATIDTSTFNAARITKLIGTTARKGEDLRSVDGLEDRPHRQSRIEEAPDLFPVSSDLLTALVGEYGPKPSSNGKHTTTAKAGSDAVARCKKYLSKTPDAVSGKKGHDKAFHAACETIRFGLSESERWEVLQWFNAEKCQPRFSDADLRHKHEDAYAKHSSQFGERLKQAAPRAQATAPTTDPWGEAPDLSDVPLILPGSEPLTIARVFVAANGCIGNLRTLQHWGSDFYRYDPAAGYRRLIDENLRAEVWRFLDRKLIQADDETKPYFPNTRRVNEVLDAMAAVCQVEVPAMPAWLRRDKAAPEPRNIIAFPNGLLDVAAYLRGDDCLLPPTPLWFSANVMPYAFDPNAGEPHDFLGFLDSIWPDDPEPIMALQQMLGYMMTQETDQQKIFLIVGPKRSGKGTIARVVTSIIGPDNVCAPTLAGLSTNFGLWPLIGKQAAIISDARLSGRTDQAIVTERLLSISGEDSVTIDRKNMAPLTTRLYDRFLILTNELPRLTDSSGALPSRFIVWTMEKSFYGQEDLGLSDRLNAERQAICLWALEGLRSLRTSGRFIQPSAALDAISEMEDLASPVGAFLRERCIIEPGRRISCERLYTAWRDWCQKQGRDHPGNIQWFGRDLRAAVPAIVAKARRVPGDGYERVYEGVDLAD